MFSNLVKSTFNGDQLLKNQSCWELNLLRPEFKIMQIQFNQYVSLFNKTNHGLTIHGETALCNSPDIKFYIAKQLSIITNEEEFEECPWTTAVSQSNDCSISANCSALDPGQIVKFIFFIKNGNQINELLKLCYLDVETN